MPVQLQEKMEEAIAKAEVLIEALPYVVAFHDKVFVIKLGGRAMTEPSHLSETLQDVVFLSAVGIRPILVHGGSPFINQEARRRGKSPRFVKGLRVTDAETLSIVFEVTEKLNDRIVEEIRAKGGQAEGFHYHSSLCVTARHLSSVKVDAKEVELGFVGEVERVDVGVVKGLCEAQVIPVIAPQALGGDGSLLNVNADQVASYLARQISAEKLVFLSDTHGVMLDPGSEASLASTLHEQQVRRLIQQEVITGGMLPKVQACLESVKAGVKKAHIIDGRISHSLLLEIFTRKGIGTEILA